MAVRCQILALDAISSRGAFPMLAGELFKKFGLFLNTPRILGMLLKESSQKQGKDWFEPILGIHKPLSLNSTPNSICPSSIQ